MNAASCARPRGTRRIWTYLHAIIALSQLTCPRGTRLTMLSFVDNLAAFQLTRPRGTRRDSGGNGMGAEGFNSRVRGGRDVIRTSIIYGATAVSTHASAGDATTVDDTFQIPALVSTHASAGDATLRLFPSPSHSPVSTHASAGDATCAHGTPRADRRVSTHASAGDATRASLLRAVQRLVSTHASAGDAMRRQSLTARSMSFQLTRPRGTRLVITRRIFVLIAVSTHASAGDATKSMPSLNPSRLFQLTRPRGTRPRFRGLYSAACSFNSRVRGGRDSCNLSITGSTIVSTHASAGDATA